MDLCLASGIHFLLLLVSYVACDEERILSLLLGNGNEEKGECKADAKESWSYTGSNAAIHWAKSHPACNGTEQSPIAITSRDAVRNKDLAKLAMQNYETPVSKANIENNGHTVQVTPADGVERSILVNGSTYNLLQMHFHWAETFDEGSEHTLNGIHYAMELHLVHQNSDKKLAVVGVFFQEQKNKNAELQNIIKSFPKVMYKGAKAELGSDLNLNNLVPANPSSFFRYAGSLTTPGCDEGVTWSVLTKALPVSKKQMAQFRTLHSAVKADATPQCKLSNNFRPVQPLNGREVYISE